MYVAKRYETDNGFVLTYTVAIRISYNGEKEQRIIDDFVFLPDLLLSELQLIPQSCTTKQVIARFVVLTLTSGEELQISCPFRPNTANWFNLLNQLQELPNVVALKGFGEKVTDKFLKNSLGIV